MSDLLGDSKTDRTLEETVSFIAQKEQGKVTRSAVGDSASAMSATCNTQKRPQAAGAKCWACGGPAHGQRNDRKARSRYCEAWTFTCSKCTVKGHYTKSCSKCTTCGVWGHRDASSRICTQDVDLHHHLFPHLYHPGLKATEEHVESLKEWLLDYYGATTFNVCEHQPLPLMNCEPLQLHVDPNATPVAVHKPALVPIHWQDKVYADLERMFALVCTGTMPIREEDRHFPTFITPWGRYRYKVAPQGFMASGDAYNQRFDAIISNFNDKVKCVDDTCMWANSIEAAFFQACEWLDLCARNGITLNPKKFQFAQDTVNFAGLTITLTNIRPSTKFLDAISNFPTPTDITGARAWFGLINQGAYAFAMARQMKPFRALLKPSTTFCWTNELDEVFHKTTKRSLFRR
ncbi:Hypothetical predicted protein [Mytilus galloprovincialis]|uniref:Reverse transcriptase domain-containing protein n=1 Tax=Mytilus galloprovincialis TaxID=29158 RepID=A0A8B6C068_MYTGA|nr:Hypothetical predicted protein [Mytilus galloprovincialis]